MQVKNRTLNEVLTPKSDFLSNQQTRNNGESAKCDRLVFIHTRLRIKTSIVTDLWFHCSRRGLELKRHPRRSLLYRQKRIRSKRLGTRQVWSLNHLFIPQWIDSLGVFAKIEYLMEAFCACCYDNLV